MNQTQIDKNGRPIISAAAMMRADCPFTDPELREIADGLKRLLTIETNEAKYKVQNKALAKTLLILEEAKK
tara:strand:- start:303 stop:515 length:213 start_codon:yes stop_codon:yes gene_type:complete